MFVYKKLTILLVSILFLFNNCTILPGINKSPNKKNPNKELETSEYSINDVKINIIKINKLSNEEINRYSENQFNDLENKIKNYSEIYDYRYEYILGISDSISIDLTDTDDLDGVYKIDQEGMIDLPFIGKIKISDLTLNEAQSRNFERWQILGNYLWPNAFVGDTYEEEITYLKNWTTERLIWMDENMIGNCNPVAITNLDKQNSLTVQPNPFLKSINFILSKDNSIKNGVVKIYDSLGKEIRYLNFSSANILEWDGKNKNGKEIPSGIYFYSFSDKTNIIESGKIIKM